MAKKSVVSRKKSPQRLMTQQQYAKHVGLTQQAISKMIRSGRIPSVHGKIDPKAADKALVPGNEQNSSLAEATRRKEWALVGLRELELDEARKRVMPIAVVKRAQELVNSNIRSRMLQLPAKLAQRLLGIEDQAKIKALVDAEVHETLTELSQTAGNIKPEDLDG